MVGGHGTAGAFGPVLEDLNAVSYTHLDVYKRQDEAFVQPLDNNDNTGEKNELATLIGNFNPTWDAAGSSDDAFFRAVGV